MQMPDPSLPLTRKFQFQNFISSFVANLLRRKDWWFSKEMMLQFHALLLKHNFSISFLNPCNFELTMNLKCNDKIYSLSQTFFFMKRLLDSIQPDAYSLFQLTGKRMQLQFAPPECSLCWRLRTIWTGPSRISSFPSSMTVTRSDSFAQFITSEPQYLSVPSISIPLSLSGFCASNSKNYFIQSRKMSESFTNTSHFYWYLL